MPGRDRTGPLGMGPMTGRGLGYCASQVLRWSAGHFFGRGGGWGHRHWFHATGFPRWARWGAAPAFTPPSHEQELDTLKGEAEWLKGQLDEINQRIDELGQEER